jgi:hypothetical protein
MRKTGKFLEAWTKSTMKFSTVADWKLDEVAPGAGFGLVKELKSKALPKLFGNCGMLTALFSQYLSVEFTSAPRLNQI